MNILLPKMLNFEIATVSIDIIMEKTSFSKPT